MRRERARGGRRRCGAWRRGRAGTLRREGAGGGRATRRAPRRGDLPGRPPRVSRGPCPAPPGPGRIPRGEGEEGEEGVSLPPRLGARPSRQRGRERVARVGETGVGPGERHSLFLHVGEGEFEARTPSGL